MRRALILLFFIAFCIVPLAGNCDSGADPKQVATIAMLKELKLENIELLPITTEGRRVKVEGYAPNSRLIKKYLHAISDLNLGQPQLREIMSVSRNGMHAFHFVILVGPPGTGNEQVPAPSTTDQANTPPANTPPANTPPANTPPANTPPAKTIPVVSRITIGANTPQDAEKVWARLNVDDIVDRNDKVSNDAKEAYLKIYGGPVWINNALSKYFRGKTKGYVAPIFEERFTDNGSKKMLVLGYITPEPGDDYFCHACVPLLGGAVFHKQGSSWVVENSQKIIGWGDVLATGRFGIIPLGPKKYGIAIRTTDSHQGDDYFNVKILVPYKGSLAVALSTGYSGLGPAFGCMNENVETMDQSVNVAFKPVTSSDYFNVVVEIEHNDGDCEHIVHKKETTRYGFDGGKYKSVN